MRLGRQTREWSGFFGALALWHGRHSWPLARDSTIVWPHAREYEAQPHPSYQQQRVKKYV
jgi:hypothetical protein